MGGASVVINGKRKDIFKDPITDDGMKKSAKGLLKVGAEDLEIIYVDQCTEEQEKTGMLEKIYKNGEFFRQCDLEEVRAQINKAL